MCLGSQARAARGVVEPNQVQRVLGGEAWAAHDGTCPGTLGPIIGRPLGPATTETFPLLRFDFIMERMQTRPCAREARPAQKGALWSQTRGKRRWGASHGRRMSEYVGSVIGRPLGPATTETFPLFHFHFIMERLQTRPVSLLVSFIAPCSDSSLCSFRQKQSSGGFLGFLPMGPWAPMGFSSMGAQVPFGSPAMGP